MNSSRNAVYEALDGERRYQFTRFADIPRSLGEFVVYIDRYLDDAKSQLTFLSGPDASVETRNSIRKIAALAVAALEQHGVVSRSDEERRENLYADGFIKRAFEDFSYSTTEANSCAGAGQPMSGCAKS